MIVPAKPIHPGEHLKDEMNDRCWSYAYLAETSELTVFELLGITNGVARITP